MSAPTPWWDRDRHADRRPRLLARAQAASAVRAWFAEAGFLEVDTATLQVAPGADPHTSAFATTLSALGAEPVGRFLHTSPEFACKKLLAAGETKIFFLGHVFRDGESSRTHHPEFTLLEWYRVGGTMNDLLADCAALLHRCAVATGADRFVHAGRTADPSAPMTRISIVEALERHAGFDLRPCLPANRDRLAAAVTRAGLRVTPDDSWSDLFSKALSHFVERELGTGAVAALTGYPASEAALAALDPADSRFAQRFELFACGLELANGFVELTDPVEQRARFQAENEVRRRVSGAEHPIDEDFLDALAHMPPSAGIALGFDRLVMLLTGAERITDVIWTPATS